MSINPVRLSQSSSKKIIVAGMSNRIEAFYDIEGEYLAGKSTSIITGNNEDMSYYLAILNSDLISYFVNTLYRSLKMAGGYLNINKNIIESIPIPSVDNEDYKKEILEIVSEGSALTDENLLRINEIIYELYEISEPQVKMIKASKNDNDRT